MMYVVLCDYTLEKADIYNAVEVFNALSSYEDAVKKADELYENKQPDESIDYSEVTHVDTDRYDECTGAEVCPYPVYVVGEAIGNGRDYHCYYMVVETENE